MTDFRDPITRRRAVKLTAAAAAGLAAPVILHTRSAFAAYPDRPVKLVVANTPGGPSDIVARIVAAVLEQNTGKTFIIENRGGAGSNIGMGFVANSNPDGYTLLIATNAFSVNVSLYNKIPYEPWKDFVAVSELASAANTFVVQSSLPSKNIKEFIALAKANPEKFNVSTPPIGTAPQLQAEVFKLQTGLTKMESVVFKGGGDALQALLNGTVQLSSGSLPPAYPHIQSGTLRCLAVTGAERWPDMPNVPTMVDEGFKDFVFATDVSLMAPAKTPKEIVDWVEKETLAVLSAPEMKDKLYKSGFQVQPKGAKVAFERMNKEIKIFKDVIEKAKIAKL